MGTFRRVGGVSSVRVSPAAGGGSVRERRARIIPEHSGAGQGPRHVARPVGAVVSTFRPHFGHVPETLSLAMFSLARGGVSLGRNGVPYRDECVPVECTVRRM